MFYRDISRKVDWDLDNYVIMFIVCMAFSYFTTVYFSGYARSETIDGKRGYSCLSSRFHGDGEVTVLIDFGRNGQPNRRFGTVDCRETVTHIHYFLDARTFSRISARECEKDYGACVSVLLSNESGRRTNGLDSLLEFAKDGRSIKFHEMVSKQSFLANAILPDDRLFIYIKDLYSFSLRNESPYRMTRCSVDTPRILCRIFTLEYHHNLLIEYAVEPYYNSNTLDIGRKIFESFEVDVFPVDRLLP